MFDPRDLRSRLAAVHQEEGSAGALLAAVLVPFVRAGDGWSLVFTRRTDDLPMHSGEISFPGGKVDPGEDPRSAALREAREELGIDPVSVDVVGGLQPVFTLVSNYLISPWVGVLGSAEFRVSDGEIAEVLIVPVTALLAAGARRDQTFIRDGFARSNPAYDVGPNTIWGATARILTDLLDLFDPGATTSKEGM